MCILILIHRAWAKFPILIAANRDEDPNRPTSRPQLLEFGGRRVLCPQDKRHGGTWIGVNDAGVVAALTNFEEDQYTLLKPPPDRSRGFVPLHALAAASANEAVARVEEFVDQGPILPFQLAIADSERIIYFGKDRRGQEKFKFNSVEHP
ncbi:MAG: NRDE family protein, partial [Planctomycetota bacterium]